MKPTPPTQTQQPQPARPDPGTYTGCHACRLAPGTLITIDFPDGGGLHCSLVALGHFGLTVDSDGGRTYVPWSALRGLTWEPGAENG